MSMASTDSTSTTTGATQLIKGPSEDNMIVLITRHKDSDIDTRYSYQFPLSACKEARSSDDTLVEYLDETIRERLGNHMDGSCIVWRMTETGQVAFVCSKDSFDAAVLDHKNANKKVIQLFVVEDNQIDCLPYLVCVSN
ncbi:hypothetical protein KCU65_g7681, partial [Aureobasidium melanogenum]